MEKEHIKSLSIYVQPHLQVESRVIHHRRANAQEVH